MMDTMKTIMAVILACLPHILQAQATKLNCWKTNGEASELAVADAVVKLTDSIAAVDLRHTEGLRLDCTSASPNCLYYTDEATAVEGLPSANVVRSDVCDGLLISDAACFYCPMAFTATDAMLRFTPKYDSSDGDTGYSKVCHETIVLPFDADYVMPANVNGPMPDGWLQVAIYLGYQDVLMFIEANAQDVRGNTPYLVTFAYAAYGTQILFCGQNKTVRKTSPVSAGTGTYRFAGTTKSEVGKLGYFRYYRGPEPYFVYTGDSKPMEPFRCFIVSDETICEYESDDPDSEEETDPTTKEQKLTYTVFEESTTGVGNTSRPTRPRAGMTSGVYDLLGRRGPTGKGVCVIGGIKVVR